MKTPFRKTVYILFIISIFFTATVFAEEPPKGADTQDNARETISTQDDSKSNKNPGASALFTDATFENFEEQEDFEVFDEGYFGGSDQQFEEATETIDPGAITLIQSAFLGNINTAFSTVANYAFNLLYLFAVLEMVIFGLIWALRRDVGFDKLFFKIIKIGLIFFIIQNYSWLLDTILQTFSQLAGVVVEDAPVAQYVFNPAKIWQYGYDSGVHLLQLATTASNNFGLALVQISLGMGILLVFGLLGIQMILQIVGFYLVSFGALILLPFGAFTLGRGMFDKAVQAVLQAGIRLMVLIIVIGVAIVVWNGFQLTDMAETKDFNINQPLGLFFTALLFLCLARYLPNVMSKIVGSFSSDFLNGGSASTTVVHESGAAPIMSTEGSSDMRAATSIDSPASSGSGGYGGSGNTGVAASQPVSVNVASSRTGGGLDAKSAETLAQASRMSKSVSENTVKSIKDEVIKAIKQN